MVTLTFFEKPGCANNTAQRRWLAERGVTVAAVDLLNHPWSERELLAYFAALPVADWFNRSAPPIKSGALVPEQLSRAEALRLLIAQPLLIRRPLLRMGEVCRVGFDGAAIARWLSIDEGATMKSLPVEECPRPQRPCGEEQR